MSVDLSFYNQLIKELSGKKVTLVAVSKTKSVSDILELYEAGQRDFGENYVQELIDKHEVLPKDIRWHFIGHLQSNKIKYILPFVHLIHGVDSPKLLFEINKQAAKAGCIAEVLLQMHIAEEESKYGMGEEELKQLLEGITQTPLTHVCIKGMMGMATFTENTEQVRKEFHYLKQCFDQFEEMTRGRGEQILSMGMSNDYQIAIEEGATLIRIGSLLFGKRG